MLKLKISNQITYTHTNNYHYSVVKSLSFKVSNRVYVFISFSRGFVFISYFGAIFETCSIALQFSVRSVPVRREHFPICVPKLRRTRVWSGPMGTNSNVYNRHFISCCCRIKGRMIEWRSLSLLQHNLKYDRNDC